MLHESMKRIRIYRIRLAPLLILLVLSLTSICIMGSALSKSGHAFLMGAMVEHGTVQKYLDEKCDSENYRLCAYKDSLPEKAWQFVWDEDSPFYKTGGWKGTRQEFNEIITGTLTSPKYLLLHIRESAKATLQQLTRFEIGDGSGVFLHGALLHKRIGTYFPRELPQYEKSLQNQNRLFFTGSFNILQTVIVVVSVAGLAMLFLIRKKFTRI